MPGENIQDWSVVALNNGNADSLINWVEGQPRASVNNSARSQMAAHAKDRNLKNGSIVTTGTANAQAFASGLLYTTIPTGLRATLKIGITNTGSATLNMDGIGPVLIKTQVGSNLAGSELAINSFADFLYNGTNWILMSTTFVQPLTGGGITTGGTGNDQTADTGLTQLIIGLRLLLKIGNTNTGPTTLDVDAAGPLPPIPVVYPDGSPLVGGELVAGSYAEFLYDGTNWILLQQVPVNPAAGAPSAQVQIGTAAVASNSANIDFKDLNSDLYFYRIIARNVIPANDGARLTIQFSNDNGATFISTLTYKTMGIFALASSGGSPAMVTFDNQVASALTNLMSNSATSVNTLTIDIYNFDAASTKYPFITFRYSSLHPTVFGLTEFFGEASNLTFTNCNAIRLKMDGGNITSGAFALYGISATLPP